MIQLHGFRAKNYMVVAIFAAGLSMAALVNLSIGPSVFAFSSLGTGTSSDPYQITDCTQLSDMRDHNAANYVLMNDIDCSDTINWNGGMGFAPVGNGSSNFNGSLDGQNHTISDLFINRPSADYQSLFGVFGSQGGVVKNVYFAHAHITGHGLIGVVAGFSDNVTISDVRVGAGSTVTGLADVGGLLGGAIYTSIVDSANEADVTGANFNIGGLVGELLTHSTVDTSYSVGTIQGLVSVGGIAGLMDGSNINNVYGGGSVTADNRAGGLVGSLDHESNDTIANSFSDATVTATSPQDQPYYGSGGLIGLIIDDGGQTLDITNNFAIGQINGGVGTNALIGSDGGNLLGDYSTNYFDINATGRQDCIIGFPSACTGVNSDAAPAPDYFKNPANAPLSTWDFQNIWQLQSNGLPRLRMTTAPTPPQIGDTNNGGDPVVGNPPAIPPISITTPLALLSRSTTGQSDLDTATIADSTPGPDQTPPEDVAKPNTSSTDQARPTSTAAKPETPGTNYLSWTIGGASIILLGIGYMVYRYFRNASMSN